MWEIFNVVLGDYKPHEAVAIWQIPRGIRELYNPHQIQFRIREKGICLFFLELGYNSLFALIFFSTMSLFNAKQGGRNVKDSISKYKF